MRTCHVRDLGKLSYNDALAVQLGVAGERKLGLGEDHLFFVEHPHVVTIGRNGHESNLLASEDVLSRAGIEVHRSDRGGDVTYHGPGQVVGYPVLDLRQWKRDVGAYVRGIEQVLIDSLADFGIFAMRVPKLTGVWVNLGSDNLGLDNLGSDNLAKIGAIGVHLSRWVTTHGWALNVTTDLKYFQYIVPCGLQKPVTSMAALGVKADAAEVKGVLAKHFARVFDFELSFEPRVERNQPEPAFTGEFR